MSRSELEREFESKKRAVLEAIDASRSEMLGDLILDKVEEWVAEDQLALEAACVR